MENNQQKNIAMFIDCDNVSSKYIDSIFKDLSQYGKINIRKAYGDWSSKFLHGWQNVLLEYNIQPYQQFAYTNNKNASDIAIVIDVIDSIYTKNIDIVALITSDSDFTPLSIYLKESGVYVIGFGKSNASEAFKNGCDEFKDIEKIPTSESNSQHLKNTAPSATKKDPLEIIHKHLQQCAIDNKKDDGYTSASDAGKYLRQHILGFTPKTYGYKNLTNLLEDFRNLYAIEKHPIPGNKNSVNVSYKLCNSTNNSES